LIILLFVGFKWVKPQILRPPGVELVGIRDAKPG
jgi:hypothetical protein